MSEKTINPTAAARALGRLGGLPSAEVKSERKVEARRLNAAKAREALAVKRATKSASNPQVIENPPNIVA